MMGCCVEFCSVLLAGIFWKDFGFKYGRAKKHDGFESRPRHVSFPTIIHILAIFDFVRKYRYVFCLASYRYENDTYLMSNAHPPSTAPSKLLTNFLLSSLKA